MASPGFAAVKGTSTSGFLLILPVCGQKVKCVSPSPLEVLLRSGKKKPTRTTDGTAIAASFGHDVDTILQELQPQCY